MKKKAGTAKTTKTVKIVCIIIILVLIAWGYRIYQDHKYRPLDSISRAVYEELGKDALHYWGKEEEDSGEVVYEYEIMQRDAETLTRFTEAINRSPDSEGKKITVRVYSEFVRGAYSPIVRLQNYSDSNFWRADYDGFYSLYIECDDLLPEIDKEVFFDPLTYVRIEGIRQLNITSQMQQTAEEKGVDWYEYWPDLEEIIIREE